MKKRLFLVSFIVLCITALYIVKTYALFETNAESVNELAIGRWSIFINSNLVSYSESVPLDMFIYDNNIHVREGYIAPGNGGSFRIDLSAEGTDVATVCTIDMQNDEILEHENIDVFIENSSIPNLLNSTKSYKVIFGQDDVSKITNINYRLIWTSIDEYDEDDNKLIGLNYNINFDVHCEQYLGE